MQGTIFNIRRYSTEDGPGIRTTVFFKGCPLSCLWCHNPESQNFNPEILYQKELCIGCLECAKVCSQELKFDQSCYDCGLCVEACLAKARIWVGEKKTPAQVMEIIIKDRLFYDQSGGGVTFSGGEPLSQPQFLTHLLTLCREERIHSALDTSGYAPSSVLLPIAELTDLFLYDLKHMDDHEHFKYTGVGNRLILENLTYLINKGYKGIIRMPLIPGINDQKENIEAIITFLKGFSKPWPLQLLPYHHMQINKYEKLNRTYELPNLRPPSTQEMDDVIDYFKSHNLTVYKNKE